MAIARSKGLTISKTMRKQQIIDAINAAAALPVMTTATIEEFIHIKYRWSCLQNHDFMTWYDT